MLKSFFFTSVLIYQGVNGFMLMPNSPKCVSQLNLAEGEEVPMDGAFMVIDDGPSDLSYSDVFKGKTVVLFGIPGALTPTCSENQMPGYVENYDKFMEKGVDTVACLAVNDPFVTSAMSKKVDPDGKILMLADGAASFVKAVGIDVDTGNFGGIRSRRCAMIVKDGKVEVFGDEGGTGFTDISSAETMLSKL
uniref:Thioredoxin domain-containing protein n=1 Tax=Aureoumbra lagunensis TaxID=44058 RepID=A0A7S3NGM2_9STRA|mmetsp:Transcript_1028/g.1282  ORF Transcript_1028/g.1282 Transcript_1028/m.1282 type:complete len:192 (-) Transcript_1028:181-756(-)|eukprot:CAMPEP_0197314036 /NCGR_PEP_ID=MMETSP0891-20130614/31774_1 /TAXON_ID=44058 ORGANISM="Aureoumbra lagunensis, Strain CCMP1510" /NCGR_SAMPLE_ID=MMETSP0891 /ASSEMBLY_ACC=CAM_ASM_000534 /LENGTH=191 /DNA_ID=CAMNT_0042802267 /DNA_START=18 /DNA_END=593 /DNA_ORIENTATION=-